MYSKILVAVDIAEEDIAQPALESATELARITGGEVRLINVRSPMPLTRMDFIPPEFFKEQEKLCMSELAMLSAKVTGLKAPVTYVSRFGGVYAEVLAEAKEWGADLVIVSAHQPSMATYLLGSNATKIVRHAECTVLVVRANKKHSLFD